MGRAATTSDVYNAIAEPRRRAIIDLLFEGERQVNDLARRLQMEQPSVSKHLRVLREVKLVNVRRDGRLRLYSANAEMLRPVHEWVRRFERHWNHQLDSIQEHAEAKQLRPNPNEPTPKRRKP